MSENIQSKGNDMARKKKTAEAPKPVILQGFKGFDKNLKCRDKQYALGETFEEPEASLCNKGLHFCEYPLDCFRYYEPGKGSRYAEVVAENPSEERESGDSKRVTKKLTIGGELSFRGLIEAAVKFTFDRATWNDSDKATAEREAASATGFQGAASATGGRGAASATGGRGAASATGGRGAASATGDYGAASATGDYGAASATGDYGAASATGNYGAASATGFQGAASATGDYGAASATGNYGAASATGDYGAASATGGRGAASATGDYGAASATGEKSVAMACGYEGKARACLGSWIVLAERDDDYNILTMRCAVIDGEILKPETYYILKNGEFVEAEE